MRQVWAILIVCTGLVLSGCGQRQTAASSGRGHSYDERLYATEAMDYINVAMETGTRTFAMMGDVSKGVQSEGALQSALIAGESAQAEAWRRVPADPPAMYATAHSMLKDARTTNEAATKEFLLYFSDHEPVHIAVGQEGFKRSTGLLKAGMAAIGQAAGVSP
jgi:uncharacterized protein YceK